MAKKKMLAELTKLPGAWLMADALKGVEDHDCKSQRARHLINWLTDSVPGGGGGGGATVAQ